MSAVRRGSAGRVTGFTRYSRNSRYIGFTRFTKFTKYIELSKFTKFTRLPGGEDTAISPGV
ncbi:MAG: hypothetical protein QM296_05025 [Bacillota bacterium]|nr:hypothetical protein [Bacillota bacterium]